MWHVSSRSGVVLVAQTAIRFLTLPYLTGNGVQAGYYLPDAELVRENYKVQLPALHDLTRFGIYISYDCRFYDTYQLVHDDDYLRGLTIIFLCYSHAV